MVAKIEKLPIRRIELRVKPHYIEFVGKSGEGEVHLDLCELCGLFIGDRQQHLDWHNGERDE